MSQSLERAMTILTRCAKQPARVTDLAGELDVHKSTALRLLQTLETRRFVRHLPDGRWGVGFGLTDIALAALDGIDVRTVARPWLARLSREFGHTVHLAELSGSEVLYVDKVEGERAVRMASRIGAPVNLQTAAVAKVILAFAPDDIREAAINRISFQRFTPTTITTRPAFVRELDQIRARGWAVDDGEMEDFVSCVAVPIRDHNGQVRAGLSLTALTAIERLDQLKEHVDRLRHAADQISAGLGSTGPKGGVSG
jgi:DNA-binding IclR family transcriptional regulator